MFHHIAYSNVGPLPLDFGQINYAYCERVQNRKGGKRGREAKIISRTEYEFLRKSVIPAFLNIKVNDSIPYLNVDVHITPTKTKNTKELNTKKKNNNAHHVPYTLTYGFSQRILFMILLIVTDVSK